MGLLKILVVSLLEGIAEELGWQVGDTLQWTDNQDGTYTLTKVQHEQRQN